MAAQGLPLTFFRTFVLMVLASIVLTTVSGAQDHDVPVSVDGIRCDSCGSECSVMCGSRNFRACCYNYIKKRSIPWPGKGGSASTGGEHPDEETRENKSPSPVSGGDSAEEGTFLYPMTIRDLMTSIIRTLNAFENRKFGRVVF